MITCQNIACGSDETARANAVLFCGVSLTVIERIVKHIVLISCVSKKLGKRAVARDLYVSTLFRSAMAFGLQLRPHLIFILSAKYGLVRPEDKIDPYDLTLNSMRSTDVKIWAERVISDLRKYADLKRDLFVFLAGAKYRKHLIPRLSHYEVPMEGLRIGEQLRFLKRQAFR